MGKSAPLFNKLLEINHLIKGRLNVKSKELEKLYKALQKDDDRLRKKQIRQEKMIKNHIIKRNSTKFQRKRNSESLQKSFYPTTNKVSLLYKNQGGVYYIKARFYWRGKQREVQVSSISNVIEIINTLIDNKILTDLKHIRIKKITWKQINKRPDLLDAIKIIASLKAQEYMLRRMLTTKLNVIHKIDDLDENTILEEIEKMQNINENIDSSNEENGKKTEGVEWYERWRKDNL